MLLAPKTYISNMNQNLQLKIHPKMIIGLQGIIPGGVSVEDFTAVTKINSNDSEIILDEFLKNGIGKKQDNFYHFENGDKLKIAVALLEKGYPIDEISMIDGHLFSKVEEVARLVRQNPAPFGGIQIILCG